MKNNYWIIILILFSTQLYAFRESTHVIPDKLVLNFPGKSQKTYSIFLADLRTTESLIREKHKKKFKILGSYIDSNEKKYNFSGKARISGDWKDHLSSDYSYSSLSVSLKKGNVGGVVHFRLLIPRTKNADYEIFWSTLMSELGFPVPLRRYIYVKINNGIERKYIFEEKPEKEFLESIGIRESPIIEYDERQVWENWSSVHNKDRIIQNVDPKRVNHRFVIKNSDFIKNKISELISLKAISNLSLIYHPYYDKDYKHLNHSLSVFDNVNKDYARHGLNAANRKYIYDPIYNDFLPIYFDGNINDEKMINDCKNFNEKRFGNESKKFVSKLKDKYLDRTLYEGKFTDAMNCIALRFFDKYKGSDLKHQTIKPIKTIAVNQTNEVFNMLEEKRKDGYPNIINVDPNKSIIEYMKYNNNEKKWIKFKDAPYSKFKKIITGNDKPKIVDDFKIFNLVNFKIDVNYNESYENIDIQDKSIKINVKPFETKYIKLNSTNSEIKINLQNQFSKIVFYHSKIINSSISSVLEKNKIKKYNENTVRYDSRLLTSCNTFIDSYFDNLNFSASNCQLEDSINFISSIGKNLKIKILNSLYDGLDSDFSDLQFNNVQIMNSGNDCIDVSSGIYNFKQIVAIQCGDKAVSVGEKSVVTINDANLSSSAIGIAVKDLSEVHLKKIIHSNLNECINLYQKKQEYGYGTLYSNKIDNCYVSIKNGSIHNIGNVCETIIKNYYFDVCIKNKKINITMQNIFPEKSTLLLKGFDNKNSQFYYDYGHAIKDKFKLACIKKINCIGDINFKHNFVEIELIDKNGSFFKSDRIGTI